MVVELDRFQFGRTPRQVLLFALYQQFVGAERPSMDDAMKALAFAEYALDHQEQLRIIETRKEDLP